MYVFALACSSLPLSRAATSKCTVLNSLLIVNKLARLAAASVVTEGFAPVMSRLFNRVLQKVLHEKLSL